MPEQEKPLEPGWYWARWRQAEGWDDDPDEFEPCEVFKVGSELRARLFSDSRSVDAKTLEIGPRLHPPQESPAKTQDQET